MTSCEKEENKKNNTGNTTPEWLIPYQGTYTGSYDGDDFGTWSLSVTNSPQLILETHSETNNETNNYQGSLNFDGTFELTDTNTVLTGTITDCCQVSGTWYDHLNNGQGEFKGWKEPGSLNCLLKQINDADGNIKIVYKYDMDGKHIKTQYYSNNILTDYGIRTWNQDELTFTYYSQDGSVEYEYKNPLPLNNLGMSEYATYIRYYENHTRYDTCYYEYNQEGYTIKSTRYITLISTKSADIEKGTEIRTYTHSNNNLTQVIIDYSVGSDSYTNIYNYSYYTEHIDHRRTHTPYLGTRSKNLRKQIESIYSSKSTLETRISDYLYEFYDIGLVKNENIMVTTNSYTYEYNNIHYYK